MPGKVHGSEGHRSETEVKSEAFFPRFMIDYEAVGKCDGKRGLPTDTKRNVYIAVEHTINGMVGQNKVQVKVDVW